ncbi:MAG: redoxin domain-containing protein [Pirellulaceae bacterium]|nr:redoxin domain-containing protein [Pirellulaceae bacterium]
MNIAIRQTSVGILAIAFAFPLLVTTPQLGAQEAQPKADGKPEAAPQEAEPLESVESRMAKLLHDFDAVWENPDSDNKTKRKARSSTTKALFELANETSDAATAVEILRWVITHNENNRKSRRAAALLTEKYFAEPGIGDSINDGTELESLLKVIVDNPDSQTQAIARFFKTKNFEPNLATQEQALLALQESHSAVIYRDNTLGDLIGPMLLTMQFRIGKIAPDIVGPDIDEEEFQLSDYRGKVVVLDFWGDW